MQAQRQGLTNTELAENFADILKDNLNARVLETLTHFAKTVSTYGYTVQVTSNQALKHLPQISDEKKQQICCKFENWSMWLENGGYPLPADKVEKVCLQRALEHYGLKADDEFLKTIDDGHIVEFYGAEMLQLYRSLNFFKITGYSLLDISIFEWYVLWNRPKKAIEDTMNDLQDVMDSYVPVKSFRIPKQIIRESYNTNEDSEKFVPRAMIADFCYSGSLTAIHHDYKVPKGFICTSRGEIIAHGEEAFDIQFI